MEKQTKNCANCKKDFTIEPEDFAFYEKIKVPVPTFCPECRKQRRLSWRNDITLYSGTCSLCKKPLVTLFAPETEMTVYCNRCWWSDKWNPRDYAMDYDFSKPFFVQFAELMRKVPILATVNDNGVGSVNSEYTHDFSFAKNCYMVFVAWKVENMMYSYYAIAGKDMVDCMNIMDTCELIYECIQAEKCFRVKWSQNCISCADSSFLYDCRNCTDCFMCGGLRNKRHCYKNQQYSQEEYEKILGSYQLQTFVGSEKAKKEFSEFILSVPRKCVNNVNCLNCTGDFLTNGKNSHFCFNVQRPENDKWIENADGPKDSHDLSVGGELSECYEGITCDHSSRNLFGIFSWKNQDIAYTNHCHTSKYLFGCAGLRNAEYCILNKQYTKEEYEVMRAKIIDHMNAMPYVHDGVEYRFGEFYPASLSYFGYNETIAQEQFPISEDEAKKKNLVWRDVLQKTKGKETISPEALPNSISDVLDSIVDEVCKCIECERNYRILPDELTLYRRMKVPLPRRCFYCRHNSRVQKRNPFKLWHRACMCEKAGHDHAGKCPNEFETSYSPDRPETVYCESCYQKEVV